MRTKRIPLHWILFPLAALFAVFPLITRGPSCGHDFSFHLENWMEVQRQWSRGVFLPHWDFRAAWNAGEPRLLFYPPVSWMLGATLGTIFPWTWTPILYTWIALSLSGFTLHRFAREYVSASAAMAAACVYLVNPYMLFTAYERTAYAELLAAAWMPWLLLEALRPRIRVVALAIPVALLWLANAPAAVVGCYSLAFLEAVRLGLLLQKRQFAHALHLTSRCVAAVLLGLGLAGIYLVPVLYEKRFVSIAMATVTGMRPWDNFIFMHTGDSAHDAVLHTASLVAILLLTAAILCGSIVLLRRTALRQTSALLCGLSIAILFLLSSASLLIWRHAPQLAFLQFPWRFIAMESAVAGVLLAMALDTVSRHRAFLVTGTIALMALSIFAANRNFRQYCDNEDKVSAQRASFMRGEGEAPTDEYTPTTADDDALARDNPPFWLAQTPNATPGFPAAPGVAVATSNNPHEFFFYTSAAAAPYLVINLRWFYGWEYHFYSGSPQTAEVRNDGLLAVSLPPGQPASVGVYYRWTQDRSLGLALSLLCLLGIMATTVRRRQAVK